MKCVKVLWIDIIHCRAPSVEVRPEIKVKKSVLFTITLKYMNLFDSNNDSILSKYEENE